VDAPDVAGVVAGWKALSIRGRLLHSPQQNTLWPPREPLLAECSDVRRWLVFAGGRAPQLEEEPPAPHASPDADCGCGIYAVADSVRTASYLWPPPYGWQLETDATVLAQVEGWGTIVPGDHGWRAEKARVVALTYVGHATPEVIDEIAAVYRVPVLDERPEVPNVGEVFVTFAGQMASSSRRSRRRCSRSRRPRSCSARRRSGRSRSVRSRRSRSATCPSQSHELVLHVMSLRCSSYAPTR
jgi:hypothetical protein